MAEQIVNGYARLFELRILHHYHLDDGDKVFDMAVAPERLLKGYDVRRFFRIQPTADTAQRLAGLRCVFLNTAIGFVVAAPKDKELPVDTLFEFVISVTDPAFFNYTALTLLPRDFIEVVEDGIAYRFKRNVFVFSNQTGHDIPPRLFLSRPVLAIGTNLSYPWEAMVRHSIKGLLQALGDQTDMSQDTDVQVVDTAVDQRLLYVHQGDIPALPPPGAPAHGIQMKGGIPDDVFALVRVAAQGGTAQFDLLNANKKPKSTDYPVFYLHFKNRSSYWRYLNQRDGTIKSLGSVSLPLTYAGNASVTGRKPSEGLVKTLPLSTAIGAPLRLVSEIFE